MITSLSQLMAVKNPKSQMSNKSTTKNQKREAPAQAEAPKMKKTTMEATKATKVTHRGIHPLVQMMIMLKQCKQLILHKSSICNKKGKENNSRKKKMIMQMLNLMTISQNNKNNILIIVSSLIDIIAGIYRLFNRI